MNELNRNSLPPGIEFEGYRIEYILGAGGFGITYLAAEIETGRKVAIKEYLPSGLAQRSDGGLTVRPISAARNVDYQWGLDRFRDEARTLTKFRHPSIVTTLRFFLAHGTAYLVMDYIEGESLGNVLERVGILSESEIRQVVRPLLDGLSGVHAAGFLHRDIKPDNIFIRRDNGMPVLLDFGAARQALGQATHTLTVIVSHGYAPFEQYTSKGEHGAWSDIYAVGATLYRCVTGERPPTATDRVDAMFAGRRDPLVPATLAGAGRYSRRLLDSIDLAMRPQPSERPQNVIALLAMLGTDAAVPSARKETPNTVSTETLVVKVGKQESGDQPSTPDIDRKASHQPFVRASWLMALLLIVVVAAAGTFYVFRPAPQSSPPQTSVVTPPTTKPSEPPARQPNEPPPTKPSEPRDQPGIHGENIRVPQESIKFRRELESGIPILVVSGEIANESRKAQRVPPMRIALLDKENRVLRIERLKIDNRALDPGKKLPFQTFIPNPPPEAVAVRITFEVGEGRVEPGPRKAEDEGKRKQDEGARPASPGERPAEDTPHRLQTRAGVLALERINENYAKWQLVLDGKLVEKNYLVEIRLIVPNRTAPEFVIYFTATGGNACCWDLKLLDVGVKPAVTADMPGSTSGMPEIKTIATGVLEIRGLTNEKTKLGDLIHAVFTYDRQRQALWQQRQGQGFDYSPLFNQHPDKLLGHETARRPLVAVIGDDKFRTYRDNMGVASPMPVRNWRYLVGQGCRPHSCNLSNGVFVIDILTDRAVAILDHEGNIQAWGRIGSAADDGPLRAILDEWLKPKSRKLASAAGTLRIER